MSEDSDKLKGRADALLAEITEVTDMLAGEEELFNEELNELKGKYEAITHGLKGWISGCSGELIALMKKNAGEIFDGEDRVELKHGSLLFQIEERVKKARGVLERLEELGIEEAIERSAKVKWDELEKWPVEKLVLVGTERKRKEVFSYELKAQS